MEDLVKLTVAASLPLWAAIAVIGVFAEYFAGLEGIGVMFVIIIVVVVVWNRTLVSFSERMYPGNSRGQQTNPYESRLRDLEYKVDEFNRKMKE